MNCFSTAYRVQFGTDFTFQEAEEITSYLQNLGIQSLYGSPFLKNVRGSFNPYFITSFDELSPDVGSMEDFLSLAKALKKHQLTQILDFVPNHMAASEQNPYFNSILMEGQASLYAGWFDIDYSPLLNPELTGKVLMPILPYPLRECLEKGLIQIVKKCEGIFFHIGDRKLPVSHYEEGIELKELLGRQHYDLCYWKEAHVKTNYRRFFDITDLIALNMEKQEVFEKFHRFVFSLIEEGIIQGIRVDHPDGLYDPVSYFQKIKAACPSTYVWVEKILQPFEEIPGTWQVDGSVGYEYMNVLHGLFIDQRKEAFFDSLYEQFISQKVNPQKDLFKAKKNIIVNYIPAEIGCIIQRAYQILKDNEFKEVDFSSYEKLFINLLASIPVYRTYVTEEEGFSSFDQETIEKAFESLKQYAPGISADVMQAVRQVFFSPLYRDVLRKLQQYMPCIFAKGFEDTFLYRYNRFIARNEVGGNPLAFGSSIEQFHHFNGKRQRLYPMSLLATSTHDSKRSEDLKMRMMVLTEVPQAWKEMLQRWEQLVKRLFKEEEVPSLNDRYFLYQTLVGILPEDVSQLPEVIERLEGYLIKSMREAKQHTSWINEDRRYEELSIEFMKKLIEAILKDAHFLSFIQEVIAKGMIYSLSSLNLKGGSPGVFDIYQGEEFFQYQLVDPDNRSKVDYFARKRALDKGKMPSYKEIIERRSKESKIHFLEKILTLRSTNPRLFTYGKYIPLEVQEDPEEEFVAFLREDGPEQCLVVSRRRFSNESSQGQAYLLLPKFEGRDIYTDQRIVSIGGKVLLKEALESYPFLCAHCS